MSFHTKPPQRDDPSLIWIDTPENTQESIAAAKKIWQMYRSDFYLTIPAIAKRLDCQPLWVQKNVLREVKHLYLNRYFRAFIRKQIPDANLPSSFYYFSYSDFMRWLNENTCAMQATTSLPRSEITQYKQSHTEIETPVFYRPTDREVVVSTHIPDRFVSIKTIFQKRSFKSLYSAYYFLFSIGATKFKIKNSLVRYNLSVMEKEFDPMHLLVYTDSL